MHRQRSARFIYATFVLIGGLGATSGENAHAQTVDCGRDRILCVATSGPNAEFDSIQAAVDKAGPGDRVVVFPGRYRGFRVENSGRRGAQLVISGMPGTVVDRAETRSETGIYLAGVSYVTVTGFEVLAQERMELGIAARDASARNPAKGLEVLDNTVSDTLSTAIYLSHVAQSRIEGNRAKRSVASHGIYLANAGSDRTEIVGNEVHDNAVNGIHFNGDASVGGDGFQSKLVVRANRIHHNGANGLNMDGVRDSVVVNNVIYDNSRHGMRGYAIDAAAGPARLQIVNNTFADNGSWAVKLSQDDGDHVIFNNVLLSDAGSLAVGNKRFRSDFNLVGATFSVDAGESTHTLEAWRRLGFGKRSVGGTDHDIFASHRAHDYSIGKGSVALRAGTRRFAGSKSPRDDVLGKRRKGRPDIGAFVR